MQRGDDGDIPTFEDAHSEMSRKGVNNQVDDTRIAMQELVSAEVSSEQSVLLCELGEHHHHNVAWCGDNSRRLGISHYYHPCSYHQ